MGKLVRDFIPDIIEKSGRSAVTRVLGEQDYLAALADKLVEEADEFRGASVADRPEELADVFEVVKALASSYGLTMSQLEEIADVKSRERGRFDRRVWLERIDGD